MLLQPLTVPLFPPPGPILFPNTPPGSETSGVVVGASGFGFVPPGGRTGGARGVYQNVNSLVAGPSLRPSLGLGPLGGSPLGATSLVSLSSFRLGPLRSPLGGPPTTRLRPSVSYSTSHGASAVASVGVAPGGVAHGGAPGITHGNSLGPLLWRLPGRSSSSSSFVSGITRRHGKGSGHQNWM